MPEEENKGEPFASLHKAFVRNEINVERSRKEMMRNLDTITRITERQCLVLQEALALYKDRRADDVSKIEWNWGQEPPTLEEIDELSQIVGNIPIDGD